MEVIDRTVHAIASNPYVILIALIFTVGPVLWQLGKATLRGFKSASEVFSTSLRSVQFKELLKNIRSGTVRSKNSVFYRRAEPTNFEIRRLINRANSDFYFYITSVLVIAVIGKSVGFGVVESAAAYTFLYSLSVFSRFGREMKAELQVLKFSVRNIRKEAERAVEEARLVVSQMDEATVVKGGEGQVTSDEAISVLREAEKLLRKVDSTQSELNQL